MFLRSIVSRNSCLFYDLQTNFTVTHVALREVNALQASFDVFKFLLEIVTKTVFALAHFLNLYVGQNLKILRLNSKNVELGNRQPFR